MNVFKKILLSLRYREAVRMADEAYENTQERHYVIPNGGNGELLVVDRSNFRKLKQKGYIKRDITVANLERECFYSTPYKDGSKRLLPVEKERLRASYFRWVVALEVINKAKR